MLFQEVISNLVRKVPSNLLVDSVALFLLKQGFQGGSAVKNPPVYAGDAGSIATLEKISRRRK